MQGKMRKIWVLHIPYAGPSLIRFKGLNKCSLSRIYGTPSDSERI